MCYVKPFIMDSVESKRFHYPTIIFYKQTAAKLQLSDPFYVVLWNTNNMQNTSDEVKIERKAKRKNILSLKRVRMETSVKHG